MENTEEFIVEDTMLWEKVKKGLTRTWLENAADTSDVEYLVEVYNDCYDGGIFDNIEDTIYDAFSDVYEAFECAVESEGNYDKYDSWFQIPRYEGTLYSWTDNSMLDKLVDEMSSDIEYLAREIDNDKVDEGHLYRDIVKDISLTQRHYSKELEAINKDLFSYIGENARKSYRADELKTKLNNLGVLEVVPVTDRLCTLIDERNEAVKSLLDCNGAFLKGALYGTIIENNAQNTNEVLTQLYDYYDMSDEFVARHKEEFDEVNLNLAKIGEFLK